MKTDPPLKILKDAEKYWQQTDESAAIRRFAHWRSDMPGWKTLRAEIDERLKRLHRVHGSFEFDQLASAVDWGVGGGAHAIEVLQRVPRLYGVDISQPTLTECCSVLEEYGLLEKFVPVLFPIYRPVEVHARVTTTDLFVSCACFQHFPGKWYSDAVLSVAANILRPGAPALIQIREDDGTSYHRTKFKNYAKGKNAIRFCSHTEEDFVARLDANGFDVLDTERQRASYLYFYLRRRG